MNLKHFYVTSQHTKSQYTVMKIYKTYEETTLLYHSETWSFRVSTVSIDY